MKKLKLSKKGREIMLKKTIKQFIILVIASILLTTPVYASNVNKIASSKKYNDIYYFDTTISNALPYNAITYYSKTSNKIITKTKTTSMKNLAGKVVWSISITATFSYNGHTANCIRCSHKYKINYPLWTLTKINSSKSGRTATTTAVMTQHCNEFQKSFKKSVTIKCSPFGIVS